jgi:hypothetical protein
MVISSAPPETGTRSSRNISADEAAVEDASPWAKTGLKLVKNKTANWRETKTKI